jgi:hypothetical protein
MSLTKQRIDYLGNELNELLEQFALKHNLTLQKAAFTYSQNMFRRKIEFQTGTAEEVGKRHWDTHSWKFGLKAHHFNMEFIYGGDTYKIIDIAHRSKKYPVLAKNLNTQKVFKFATYVIFAADIVKKAKNEMS